MHTHAGSVQFTRRRRRRSFYRDILMSPLKEGGCSRAQFTTSSCTTGEGAQSRFAFANLTRSIAIRETIARYPSLCVLLNAKTLVCPQRISGDKDEGVLLPPRYDSPTRTLSPVSSSLTQRFVSLRIAEETHSIAEETARRPKNNRGTRFNNNEEKTILQVVVSLEITSRARALIHAVRKLQYPSTGTWEPNRSLCISDPRDAM